MTAGGVLGAKINVEAKFRGGGWQQEVQEAKAVSGPGKDMSTRTANYLRSEIHGAIGPQCSACLAPTWPRTANINDSKVDKPAMARTTSHTDPPQNEMLSAEIRGLTSSNSRKGQ